jgi:oligoendopeptidase F
MKKNYEKAKDGKEKAAALVEASEQVLHDLNQVIGYATGNLEQQVEQYANLSLSGSFSAQVGSAVRLLEQNYAALETKDVDPDQLKKVKRSLDHMKRKLELLNKARVV